MMRLTFSARSTVAASAATVGALLLSACNPKQELLAPQQPGTISPSSVNSATAADAVYVGAMGRWNRALNGGGNNQEAIWNFEALFTDELRSSDTFSQRNDADQRQSQPTDGVLGPAYETAQQARGRARDAINLLLQFDQSPAGKTHVGEMYLMMGDIEMTLSEAFCNGVPFGETVDGIPQYTAGITNADGFKLALARFDTALTYLTGTDASTVNIKNAVLVARGRAKVNLGDFAGAAAEVANVPANFQYNFDYSLQTANNEWWIMGPSVKRYNTGDSVDVAGQIQNAIPFARLNDPRVAVKQVGFGEDNVSVYFQPNNWGQVDPVPVFHYVDAQLIIAESKLQQNDFAGMTQILNAIRTSGQTMGVFKVPAMGTLTAPTSKDAAVDLLFREKALWQWLRGWRMEDMRRLVRQYGRTQDKVFPTGPFTRNGTPSGNFGTEVAFPIPNVGRENNNPLFSGDCLDTKA